MSEYMLEVTDLEKHFSVPRGIVGTFLRKPRRYVHAIDGISFRINKGEILALVGESGSGKTTTALCSTGLLPYCRGTVLFDGENIQTYTNDRKRWKQLRRKTQLIFQDPYESLNPRQSVFATVAESLEVHKLVSTHEEKIKRVTSALEDVGIQPAANFFNRIPQELSGGQRQRVSIASAIVLQPQMLVADEPVSMLDVSIRTGILKMLLQLRDEHRISLLYITHDLATAAYIADRVAVMYLGAIMEIGPVLSVLGNPEHPYTRALISVIPDPSPTQNQKRIILKGETPDPTNIPSGCRFHTRCPEVMDDCHLEIPELREFKPDHKIACRLPRLMG